MSKQIKSHDGTSPDPSKGLWTRCDQCGEILYVKHLRENYSVCHVANCNHHLRTNSNDRIASILEFALAPRRSRAHIHHMRVWCLLCAGAMEVVVNTASNLVWI